MSGPRIGSICTGYGGLDMAAQRVFDADLAWVADIDPGANKILSHHYPNVPNLGDITAADWSQVEPVDIVTGGYPCQPFSLAGLLKGTADARHIWPYIANALRVLRPRVAVFENVANHVRLGFGSVLADLAGLGFDAEWCTVRASEVGAPHLRNRLFLLAVAQDADSAACDQWRIAAPGQAEGWGTRPDSRGRSGAPTVGSWGGYAPAVHRWESVLGRRAPWATDDRNRLSPAFVEWMMGLPAGHVTAVPGLTKNQQVHALGNGVVPAQAEAAIRLLWARAHAGMTA